MKWNWTNIGKCIYDLKIYETEKEWVVYIESRSIDMAQEYLKEDLPIFFKDFMGLHEF